jgi:hypothetical protein
MRSVALISVLVFMAAFPVPARADAVSDLATLQALTANDVAANIIGPADSRTLLYLCDYTSRCLASVPPLKPADAIVSMNMYVMYIQYLVATHRMTAANAAPLIAGARLVSSEIP